MVWPNRSPTRERGDARFENRIGIGEDPGAEPVSADAVLEILLQLGKGTALEIAGVNKAPVVDHGDDWQIPKELAEALRVGAGPDRMGIDAGPFQFVLESICAEIITSRIEESGFVIAHRDHDITARRARLPL